MTTFLGMLLVILATAAVGWPLFRKVTASAAPDTTADALLDDLMFQRETTFAAISELDADHEMGNLSDRDHLELRQRYAEKSLSILKAIDELGSENGTAPVADDRLSDEIESEVRQIRRKGGGHRRKRPAMIACWSCGDAVPAHFNFCPHCGARLVLVCSGCGAERETGDHYCARCGSELEPSHV